ncbi:hypothetical protein ACWDZ6_25715 [Streptomyces sp. NPDC002926]
MLEYIGAPPYDGTYRHLRQKLDRFDFTGRRGNTPQPLVPRGELLGAVAESYSLAGVMRALCHSQTATFSRRFLSRRRGQ